MRKIIGSLLGIFIVLLVVVVLAKNTILKVAVEQSVTRLTGFKTTVQSLQYNYPSTIHIQGLEIKNPSGFQSEVFTNIPEIYAQLELQELLKGKKIHLPEVRLNLQEVHIEKNAQGVSNIELLSSVGGKKATTTEAHPPAQPAEKKDAMPFQLDRLVLTIRQVSYEDRSGIIGRAPLPGKKLNVDLNVKEEVFTNITDPQALVNVILVKILNSATLGRILDIDPKQLLGDNAAKVLSTGQEVLTQQTANVTKFAGQAASSVTNAEMTRKAEALVGSSVGGAKNVLGGTASSAKEGVSGMFGKLKALQPGENSAEATKSQTQTNP